MAVIKAVMMGDETDDEGDDGGDMAIDDGSETDDGGDKGSDDWGVRLMTRVMLVLVMFSCVWFFFKGRSNNNDALVLTTLKILGHNSLEKYAEKAHIWLLNSKKIPTQK